MRTSTIAPGFTNHKKDLEAIINNFSNEGYILGNQKRNEIRVIDFNDITLNIKSFKQPGVINKFIYSYFRKSKAERSYTYANFLKTKNIGTPQPIAYFENKNIFGLKDSYYISEHINADLTYRELSKEPDFPDNENILRKFVHFTHSLHENNILFKDHSPGNTLIKKTGNDYSFYLVDLNRMDFKTLSFLERMKNFSRLTRKKEMVEIMSDEYSVISGIEYNTVFNEMWKQTTLFRTKFDRKKRLKKKFLLKK